MLSVKYLEGIYNPVGRRAIFDDPNKWTELQREIVMGIANAKFDAFSDAVEYVFGS